MFETGKVIKTENGNATLRFARKSECAKCGMCPIKKNEPYFDLTLNNTVNAKDGDLAEVSMADSFVLLSSFIVYVIPLITTAIGLITGFFIGGDGLALLLGLVFLVIGFFAVIFTDRIIKKRNKNALPVIVRIVKESDAKENTEQK